MPDNDIIDNRRSATSGGSAAPSLVNSMKFVASDEQVIACAKEAKRILVGYGNTKIKATGIDRATAERYRKMTKSVHDTGMIIDHIRKADVTEQSMVLRLATGASLLRDRCAAEQHNGDWVVWDVAIRLETVRTSEPDLADDRARHAAAVAMLGGMVSGTNIITKQLADGSFGMVEGADDRAKINVNDHTALFFDVTFVDTKNAEHIEREAGEPIRITEQARATKAQTEALIGAVSKNAMAGAAAPAATFTAEDVQRMIQAEIAKVTGAATSTHALPNTPTLKK